MHASADDLRAAWLNQMEAALRDRRQRGLLRNLQPIDTASGPEIELGGRTFLQFASNNYLGLAGHPQVLAAAVDATHRLGAGAGASRLVAGSLAIHHQLEEALARFKNAQAALLFPSGFMANLAVLTTFAAEGDLIVSDKLNHASLMDAARFSGALHRTFPHLGYARAADLLRRDTPAPAGRRFLVSDSLFSMDGDLADLPTLCAVARSNEALVILDEAHATGVMGESGAGVAQLQQVEDRVALSIGTLSKALGSLGGFVTGPRAAIDYLINHARSFIYTTALPPACAAAALAALRVIADEPQRRTRLLALAEHTRHQLTAIGYECGRSASAIIPVILGDSAKALRAAESLKERGIFVPAIRPPTVAPNTARLRISLMATHSDAQIERLINALRELAPQLLKSA